MMVRKIDPLPDFIPSDLDRCNALASIDSKIIRQQQT